MNEEFGWAAIEDVKIFKEVAEVKLSRKFHGNWKVLVFNSMPKCFIKGVKWSKNDMAIFCLHNN